MLRGGVMGILRNSIEVIGLATEDELPKKINGQLIEYSETDYIYVPENRPLIYSISKIEIKLNVKESRIIEAPTGKIIILDGSRKLNITYRPAGYAEENYVLKFDLPFNTFIDLPNSARDIKSIDIHAVDAYFKLMNSRKIYCFIVYMINADYKSSLENKFVESSAIEIKGINQKEYE